MKCCKSDYFFVVIGETFEKRNATLDKIAHSHTKFHLWRQGGAWMDTQSTVNVCRQSIIESIIWGCGIKTRHQSKHKKKTIFKYVAKYTFRVARCCANFDCLPKFTRNESNILCDAEMQYEICGRCKTLFSLYYVFIGIRVLENDVTATFNLIDEEIIMLFNNYAQMRLRCAQ